MNPSNAALTLVVLASVACKSGRPLVLIDRELPARSGDRILERMLAADTLHPHYYSAKAGVDITVGEEHKSFKAQVRSVRDSAAWISVVPALGIEVARILLTPDSLKMLDKLHDQYFLGDTAAAKRRFGLQPSLSLLQEALLGKAIGLDPGEKYRSDREDGQYVLTSKERRRFVRAAQDISPGDTLARDRDMGERRLERTLRRAEEREAVVFRYWVEPDGFRVSRVQIADLVHDQTAEVRYEERGGAEVGYLPSRISITLTDSARIAIGTLDLSRIDIEGPLQMNFKIPESYEPMP
ncbi:MAG: DUF4292 domain-containing protein [Flavobacteriales bacterium]|nr:DUF4292 domain-containing protein [Flavobacteriales bacterium]